LREGSVVNAASKDRRAMTSDLLQRRLTLEQYERMVEGGILTSGDRVELLDGEIVEKVPIGTRHSACVIRLQRLFMRALDDGRATVAVQSPLGLPPNSEPEPDVALLKPRADDYASLHPRPQDVLLVVEVCDSSIGRDRVKLRLYARAGIPEVWLVDLTRNLVDVYRRPDGARYAERATFERAGRLTPLHFPAVAFTVDDVLPP
jgi:Uma2 family endonuclease